ncbi:hypothetical protein LP420_40235 [Massilia sp. B-10]|nr:hypothetical protein LP420_40235 [Massilia sp. B-10]
MAVINKNTEAFIGNGAHVTGDGQGAGLAAATGEFGVSYVADTAKVAPEFNSNTVNEADDSIDFGGSSGLATGDAVTYRRGLDKNNVAIDGLDTGGLYFVRMNGNHASFYNTRQGALDGDVDDLVQISGGAGDKHVLERSDILEAQDASSKSTAQLQSGGEVSSPAVSPVDTNGDEANAPADPALSGNRTLLVQTNTVQGVAVSATNRDDIETYSAALAKRARSAWRWQPPSMSSIPIPRRTSAPAPRSIPTSRAPPPART